jgi:hypothetical protein
MPWLAQWWCQCDEVGYPTLNPNTSGDPYKTNAIKTAFGHHHAKKLVVGSTKDRSNC